MTDPTVLRLCPGDDLRCALEALAVREGASWLLVSGIGSLNTALLRYAGAKQPEALSGPLELLSLCGTLCPDGAHLHAVVADSSGIVRGGHICAGCTVATTAELGMLRVTAAQLRRELDAATGYSELRVFPD